MDDRAAHGAGPILVLASGQRCGSTLVQRLLTSHPRIMIWGEHGGQIGAVLDATRIVRWWCEQVAAPARSQFDRGAHQSWIANLMPGPEAADRALRAFVDQLFARPAAAHGRPSWGFKEVRLGLSAAHEIRELYPGTRVIHLTRDPRAVLCSLDWWERNRDWSRAQTEDAVGLWLAVNREFRGAEAPWLQSWRYEDVMADTDGFTESIAGLVGIRADELDRSVFDRRIRSYPVEDLHPRRAFGELPPELRALVEEEPVRGIAGDYGYRW